MPAKSVGTVQSSFLLNVSPPPIYNVGLRLENDNKCMLARKFCNTCLATCSSFFTTLYKGGGGGGGSVCLKKGNELKNIHFLRVQSRCSNYFWRALSNANFKGGRIEHDLKVLYRGFRWCSFHWSSQNCDLTDL